MDSEHAAIVSGINAYYSQRLREHGSCARGVDWNGETSQTLRFEQLLKIIGPGITADSSLLLNDFGCGYGALLDHLHRQGTPLDYHGFDLSGDMIAAARQRHHGIETTASFEVAAHCERVADYSVASGLFNVKQGTATAAWEAFVMHVLQNLDACSRRGFAFNCLTRYSDADRMREHLYYADPCFYFDYCKRHFAKDVALLHDYGLYEFTVLVRKST